LDLNIDASTSRALLYGDSVTISSVGNASISTNADFSISSNLSLGGGTTFGINSRNIIFDSTSFNSLDPVKIESSQSGSFTLDTTKNLSSLSPNSSLGVLISSTNLQENIFEFRDSNSVPILSSVTKGPNGSRKYSQTIFGSTGGNTGGTAGPYFYHAKKIKSIRQTPSLKSVPSGSQLFYFNTVIGGFGAFWYEFDLTNPALWDSEIILLTASDLTSALNIITGGFSGTQFRGGIYLRIPSNFNSANKLWNSDISKINKFRIFYNDISPAGNPTGKGISPMWDAKILGFVFCNSTCFFKKAGPLDPSLRNFDILN
jgi:hypothetical protein